MMTLIAYTDLIGSIKSAILEHDLKKEGTLTGKYYEIQTIMY